MNLKIFNGIYRNLSTYKHLNIITISVNDM